MKWALFIGVIVALLIVVGVATVEEQQAWDRFSVEHHCKVVGVRKPQTMTTILTDGKVGFTTIPEQTTYACDDGKEYTR